ncbi:hypothetical protein O7626_12945 [Micromonospora sp. WMMD1102]|uniref:hypothetical protein n=1 Tax=Micromonospora sp. WMMD1102 TaxID=3016105 RepID=UPI0024153087|nr:hypothetical protein [Micromonospora sp. WMMD1102]MDG4786825.1 hypothetical protein [Micromonospora sp. WMMD1102]
MTLRPYGGFRAHTHTRPLFRCRACGALWPCGRARLVLIAMYRGNPAGLREHLTARLALALADQPDADPAALTARFLGWIPPDR